MGEYADYQIQQHMDAFGDSPFGGRDRTPRTNECKQCGKGGLTWEDDNGRWVLISKSGEIHKCDQAKVHAAVLNDFDTL